MLKQLSQSPQNRADEKKCSISRPTEWHSIWNDTSAAFILLTVSALAAEGRECGWLIVARKRQPVLNFLEMCPFIIMNYVPLEQVIRFLQLKRVTIHTNNSVHWRWRFIIGHCKWASGLVSVQVFRNYPASIAARHNRATGDNSSRVQSGNWGSACFKCIVLTG